MEEEGDQEGEEGGGEEGEPGEVEGEPGEVEGEGEEEDVAVTDLRKTSVRFGLDSKHYKTWRPKLLMKSSLI